MIMNVTAFLPLYTDEKHDWDGVVKHCTVENKTTGLSEEVECSAISTTEVSIIISVFSIDHQQSRNCSPPLISSTVTPLRRY